MDNERCRVIAATLDNFWRYYQNLASREFLNEYRKRSILIGRDIFVSSREERRPAYALMIDDDCGLVVRYENGETETINSGEVSANAY
jgi:BirA family biotin operon repressor/biotin-[acetyl-CoA-carboxylase] ligase